MPPAPPSWLRRYAHIVRLLAVVLALAGQIGAGASAGDAPQSRLAALDAAMVFCQSGQPPGHHQPPPARHLLADPALLVASAGIIHPVAILSSVPVLPAPSTQRTGLASAHAARAPPARPATTTYPTGPPSLV
jgi:hypothetical protein